MLLIGTLVCLGGAMGFAIGVQSKRSKFPLAKGESGETLMTLQGRLLHARNMGMRLQELASSEERLQKEQKHLSRLHRLKNEVQWLLATVESQLTQRHLHHPDRLEDMLDATGKSLRLLLDAGRCPEEPWNKAFKSLHHIHKTLCLVRGIPSQKEGTINTQHALFVVNNINLTQQLIEMHRTELIDDVFPFSSQPFGVTAFLKNGSQREIKWSQKETES